MGSTVQDGKDKKKEKGLTVKHVSKLLRHGDPGRHIDSHSGDPDRQRGLYLVVRSKTSASWELRYQLDGRPHWYGIGPARVISLQQARARAKAAREQLVDKIDPLDAKRAERAAKKAAKTKALTFREAAQRYFKQHEAKWTNASHRDQFLVSLTTFAFPVLGDMDVATVQLADVLRVIEPIWNTKTVTADRVITSSRGCLRVSRRPPSWQTSGTSIGTGPSRQSLRRPDVKRCLTERSRKHGSANRSCCARSSLPTCAIPRSLSSFAGPSVCVVSVITSVSVFGSTVGGS